MLNQRVLIYTIALDIPGQSTRGEMAKILAGSLLRTFFTGDLVIVHNQPAPLFRVEQKGLHEVFVEPQGSVAETMPFAVQEHIPATRYDWVCCLDCATIALRNVDHLFDVEEKVDLLWLPEPATGADCGAWAVRGSHYQSVMREWRAVAGEQIPGPAAWQKLLAGTALVRRPFERDEIVYPLQGSQSWLEWRGAALLRAAGAPGEQLQREFLMTQFLGRFAGEPPGLMLSLLMP